MAEKKPPGVSWESWVERQIRDSMERGEFDNLPGAGKPLPTIALTDEAWWIREKLRHENVSYLPPTLAIRKELDNTMAYCGCNRVDEITPDILFGYYGRNTAAQFVG